MRFFRVKPDHRWQPIDVYEMTRLAGETSLPSRIEPRSKHSEQHQHQAESEKAFIWLRTQALPRARPCWSNPVTGPGGETASPSQLIGSQGLHRTCILLRTDSESGEHWENLRVEGKTRFHTRRPGRTVRLSGAVHTGKTGDQPALPPPWTDGPGLGRRTGHGCHGTRRPIPKTPVSVHT